MERIRKLLIVAGVIIRSASDDFSFLALRLVFSQSISINSDR